MKNGSSCYVFSVCFEFVASEQQSGRAWKQGTGVRKRPVHNKQERGRIYKHAVDTRRDKFNFDEVETLQTEKQ